MKNRVAFVVQRCGTEVNGGAEVLCLATAQHMSAYWQTEILTTCALDYVTWANHYNVGIEQVGNTSIRRFPVAQERDIADFNARSDLLNAHRDSASLMEQEEWMRSQGPWCPEMFAYLEQHVDDYDAFIFFGYLYATTWFGLPKVASKAILAPLAHDEWTIYCNMWDQFFKLPNAFIYNTPEEKDFVHRRFPSLDTEGPVAGIGIDRSPDIDPARFRRMFGIDDGFLLYVGRIDPSKGCGELFDYYIQHRSRGGGPSKLVLLGKPVMPIPQHPDIISLGFVSEGTKWDALAACDALVMPSFYESLSMVLLEAWSVGKPVLVNGRCDVLVGQCRRSDGGLWYSDATTFTYALTGLLEGRTPGALGRQGFRYVRSNYSWRSIENIYSSVLDALGA